MVVHNDFDSTKDVQYFMLIIILIGVKQVNCNWCLHWQYLRSKYSSFRTYHYIWIFFDAHKNCFECVSSSEKLIKTIIYSVIF